MTCKIARNYSLYLAWLVALVATMISLYLSVIQHWPVCDLCWYQRICIYPLVIILGIAAYRDDRAVVLYTMPLATLGLLFSLYQYLEQMIPGFAPLSLCGMNSPSCSHIHFQWLGFVTFPFLGMIAFFAIIIFLASAACCRRE